MMEMVTKICNRCNNEKSLDFYGIDKKGKYGKKSICKTCINEETKIFYIANKERISEYHKQHNAKPEIKAQRKEKNKEWRKAKLAANKELMVKNAREKQRKRREDPMFKFIEATRNRIRNSIRHSGNRKNSKTAEILGCSFEDFRIYLESKFEPWMTWENRGLYNGTPNFGWDIDHIIPTHSAITEKDVLKLNHHTNLQPLCSYINRDIKKGVINPFY